MASSKLREYRRKRDFRKTAEPAGGGARADAGALEFVIQKHAASHLHYDLRLEAGGVMKSWAVPKGPSLDPDVKRLAVEVEDHPIEYNAFEGTIPKGEYGGGTVMLWDRGTFVPDGGGGKAAAERALLKAHRAGRIEFELHGERLRGEFMLLRTRRAESPSAKPQWLLMKKDDRYADAARDITAEVETSVASGRTMREIAAGKGGGRVWRSNRAPKVAAAPRQSQGRAAASAASRGTARKRIDPARFSPMLASAAEELPTGEGWTFEPKYDGIRVLAFAAEGGGALITRNGNDKAAQFPEILAALRELAESLERPLVLDGEIVPLSGKGVGRFEALQSRMHVQARSSIRRLAEEQPATLVAFDLLLDGDDVLLDAAWAERRARLEAVLAEASSPQVQLAETSPKGEAMLARARRSGWEGVMAKRTDAPYALGKRSRAWLKIKVEGRQEFVVGGWTEPRNSRAHIGALLLGYWDGDDFVYAGHTGSGFTHDALRAMHRRLKPLRRETPPFVKRPRTNEKAYWVEPEVVVEVKFNEWTKEGKLRQPVFLGVREDKDPRDVVREMPMERPPARAREASPGARAARKSTRKSNAKANTKAKATPRSTSGSKSNALPEPPEKVGGVTLTNFGKVWFPKEKVTKGEVLAYYHAMAKYILPFMKDRPLVLKRFPDGIDGEAFYQQAPGEKWPKGVRVEEVPSESGPQKRFIGGNRETLLYTIQLGAISYDPWHSRVGKLDFADYSVIDLDPQPGATFRTVIEVAGYVKEALDELELKAALKTSGSRGLHVYVPLPARTPWQAATLVAQIVATRVAERHPKVATVVRTVKRRPRGTIYVDYLQNILGKTIAGVYAVRAKPGATVSTPLSWDELTKDLDLREFTVRTVPARVAERGEVWGPQMQQRNSLKKLMPRGSRRAGER